MKIYSVFVAYRLHSINDPSLEKATESSQFTFQVTFLYNYLYRIYLPAQNQRNRSTSVLFSEGSGLAGRGWREQLE